MRKILKISKRYHYQVGSFSQKSTVLETFRNKSKKVQIFGLVDSRSCDQIGRLSSLYKAELYMQLH